MRALTKGNLWRGWAWLFAFSLASTFAAQGVEAGVSVPVTGTLILALAWLKARLILTRYLGLAAGSFWGRGFGMVLAFFMIGLLVLYLMPLV